MDGRINRSIHSFSQSVSHLPFFLPVVIDIADENGSLKHLSERPHEQYASEYIQGRGNYVLLKVTSKLVFPIEVLLITT